jgi:hypothetical protein
VTSRQLGVHATFLPTRERRGHAETWLELVLAQWCLQPGLAGRWLASAERHLNVNADVTLFVEYDQRLSLFTLEVQREGRRVYGIDDFLG